MTRSILARSCTALAILTLAAAASAEVYTWKDANGQVHYSDQPPPNVDVKSTKPAAGPKYVPATPDAPAAQSGARTQPDAKTDAKPPVAQSGPKTWQEKDLENRQQHAAQQEAEAKRKEEADRADEKKRYCESLRSNLATLQNGGRVTVSNAAGERVYLDDTQMKQEADRTRNQLTRDCSK